MSIEITINCEILTKGDEQSNRKRTSTTFGAAFEERKLTFIELRRTSAKVNQVSDLTIV